MPWMVDDVYELRGIARDKTVYILGTGPSLDAYPLDQLEGSLTIGLNTILNVFDPTYWLFGDGKFARWGAKRYKEEVESSRTSLIVNEKHLQFLERHYSEFKVYCFTNQDKYSLRFLAGRWTIATIALSLATLMDAKRTILIGIDMGPTGSQFYSAKVGGEAPGKQLSMMGQWRKWLQYGFKQELWPIDIFTVSPHFHEFCPGTSIRPISIEDSLPSS